MICGLGKAPTSVEARQDDRRSTSLPGASTRRERSASEYLPMRASSRLSSAPPSRTRSALPVAERAGTSANTPAAREIAHAHQQARLAQDVYNQSLLIPQGSRGVAGWQNISHDTEGLEVYGLAPEDLEPGEGSGFRARLYAPEGADDATPRQLVFRGTEPISGAHDWVSNVRQTFGLSSDHINHASAIGRKVGNTSAPLEFCGHSLGGTLATVAALTSGRRATVFNSAGLHSRLRRSLSDDGLPLHNGVEIQGYHIKGEWVTAVQRHSNAPEALGTSVSLDEPKNLLRRGKLIKHSLPVLFEGLQQKADAIEAGAPLVHRVRPSSVPPFGYLNKTPSQLETLLEALIHHSPREHRQETLNRINQEAKFVLKVAWHVKHKIPMQTDTLEFKILAKEWMTEIPEAMTPENKASRLAELAANARTLLNRLAALL